MQDKLIKNCLLDTFKYLIKVTGTKYVKVTNKKSDFQGKIVRTTTSQLVIPNLNKTYKYHGYHYPGSKIAITIANPNKLSKFIYELSEESSLISSDDFFIKLTDHIITSRFSRLLYHDDNIFEDNRAYSYDNKNGSEQCGLPDGLYLIVSRKTLDCNLTNPYLVIYCEPVTVKYLGYNQKSLGKLHSDILLQLGVRG